MLLIPVTLLALLSIINAQSTVNLFLPGFDVPNVPLVASVKGSDQTATTYVLACSFGVSSTAASATPTSFTDGSDSSNEDDGCDFGGPSLTLTQGPSTVIVPYSSGDITATIDCILDGTTSATCTCSQTVADEEMSSMTEPHETFTSVMTTTLGPDSVTFMPVTITAGAAKGEATASATSAASSKETGTSTSPAAASSTGGAAALDASATIGGFIAFAIGLVAAVL